MDINKAVGLAVGRGYGGEWGKGGKLGQLY